MATKDNRDNDTSVQSKVERDKTVATKEGSPERPRGGEIPMTRLTNLGLLFAPIRGIVRVLISDKYILYAKTIQAGQ